MYLTITPQEKGPPKIERHEGVPDLETMQEIVGGWIEAVSIHEEVPTEYHGPGHREITVWLNEEGKLIGLRPCVAYPPLKDVLMGPLVVTAVDMESGETVSLTEEEADRVRIGPSMLLY